MQNEKQKLGEQYVWARLNEMPKPALDLFTDETKFLLYLDFKEKFAGEPSGDMPVITRDRGGVQVAYDTLHQSAMTESGSHLVHIRTGRNMKSIGLKPELQYFVVTADFNTYDTTEWWIEEVSANKLGEPTKLDLILSHQPVHEVVPVPSLNPEFPVVGAIGLKYAAQLVRAQKLARSIRYTHEHQRSQLTWGDGSAPETFRSTFDIENDLWLLHYAEQQGLLDGLLESHTSIRNYLAA